MKINEKTLIEVVEFHNLSKKAITILRELILNMDKSGIINPNTEIYQILQESYHSNEKSAKRKIGYAIDKYVKMVVPAKVWSKEQCKTEELKMEMEYQKMVKNNPNWNQAGKTIIGELTKNKYQDII